MNEETWNVYQLHHDVISALLSVKCTEVIIDMKRNQKVWVFWGKYIFSINKITVNTNTFIISMISNCLKMTKLQKWFA